LNTNGGRTKVLRKSLNTNGGRTNKNKVVQRPLFKTYGVSQGGGKTGLRGDKRSGFVHVSTCTKKKKRKRGSYNGQHMVH